jgi:DNA-damage-inducible protein J
MSKTSSIHIRINPEIKDEVEPILDDLGITFTELFNMLLNQIRIRKKIPFNLISSYYVAENEEVIEIGKEVINRHLKAFSELAK